MKKFKEFKEFKDLFYILLILSILTYNLFVAVNSLAKERAYGFLGLEFLGSSELSNLEINEWLKLKLGSSEESAHKSIAKLEQNLSKKNIHTSIALVPDDNGYFIAVDVIPTALSTSLITRKLIDPHHIALSNEKPFLLLAEIHQRQQKLAQEGRPAKESYENGCKVYSDVVCMRLTEKIMKELAGDSSGLWQIIESDPDGKRRQDAVELLNWLPDFQTNSQNLISVLDDSDLGVRIQAAKYIWARLDLLSDDFPFNDLAESFSRQLARPSHQDRLKALGALFALANRFPSSCQAINSFSEPKLTEILTASKIPVVLNGAKQLKSILQNPPIKKEEGVSAEY